MLYLNFLKDMSCQDSSSNPYNKSASSSCLFGEVVSARSALPLFLSCFLVLSGCTQYSSVCHSETSENSAIHATAKDEYRMDAKLIDGAGTDTWILAADTLYQMPAVDRNDIANGMYVTITWDGNLLDHTWPQTISQVEALEVREQEKDNRCEIGWTILESLWHSDPALQADIQYVCIDLTEADFLSDQEKDWLISSFADTYASGLTLLKENMEQLKSDGYLSEDGRSFENGVYLAIRPASVQNGEEPSNSAADEAAAEKDETAASSETRLELEGIKWRSALGADFMNFEAEKVSGDWSLQLVSQAVA